MMATTKLQNIIQYLLKSDENPLAEELLYILNIPP